MNVPSLSHDRASLVYSTNTPPLSSEIPFIHEQLRQSSKTMEALEGEITELTSRLSALQSRKARAAEDQRQLRGALSPIRRVPDVVVAKIIKVCTQPHSKTMNHENRLDFLSLRTVCKRWRQVALATPILWSGLSLRLDEISSDDGKDLFSPFRNRIRGWFDRARGAPLSFHISCKSSEDKGLNFIDRIAIMSLLAEDRNWASIALIGIDDASCLPAFRNVENADYHPWKNVKTASIPVPMVTRPEQTSWPFCDDFDVHAPSLQTLSLDATSCMAFPAPPRIIHQHLETLQLTVRALLGTGIPNLIDNLPNLVTFCPWCDGSISSSDPERTVWHARLQHFSTHTTSANILRHYTFPNLRTLRLEGHSNHGYYTELDGEVVLSFLRRSQCPLRVLMMAWARLPMESLNRFLRSLPKPEGLECLSLATPSLIGHLTRRIQGGEDVEDILRFPSLRLMEVFGKAGDVSPRTLLSYMESIRKVSKGKRKTRRSTVNDSALPPLCVKVYPAPWRNAVFDTESAWSLREDAVSTERLKDLGVKLEFHCLS